MGKKNIKTRKTRSFRNLQEDTAIIFKIIKEQPSKKKNSRVVENLRIITEIRIKETYAKKQVLHSWRFNSRSEIWSQGILSWSSVNGKEIKSIRLNKKGVGMKAEFQPHCSKSYRRKKKQRMKRSPG